MPALAFVGVFKLVLQNIRRDARLLWARRLRNHTIVCGLGDTGAQIVESFRDAGKQVVVIALNSDTPYAATCERRHVAVLEGDAARPSMLKLAGLKHAHSLVVACGSDGANLEIGMRARDTLKGLAAHPVKILPELRSGNGLYDLVKTQGAGALGSADAEFQLFNLNSNAARLLLQSESFLRGVPDAAPQPHLLFAGFGQMGRGNPECGRCAPISPFRARKSPRPSWMSEDQPVSPGRKRAAPVSRISPTFPRSPASSLRTMRPGKRAWSRA